MADYNYVIVGVGLNGLTIAERIANELDNEVRVIEKRDHIDRINYEKLIYTGPIDYFYDYKYGSCYICV